MFLKRPSRYVTVRGSKPGFSALRLWQMLWYDNTRVIEALLGGLFFVFRGVFLVRLGYDYPGVEYFLLSVGLSETKLGWLCIIFGVLHLYGSATEFHGWRMIFCTLGMALSVTVIASFGAAEPDHHPIAVLWATILMFEFYLVLRNFMGWRNGPDTDGC